MKRFLSILLAVAMTISMVLPVFAYTDTADSDYAAAIEHLSGLGVINGYEDGSYQPGKVVTRAEMAKLLVVALGLADGVDLLAGESGFDDVAANHWAIGYINVATQYGLIKGDGDGNFRPDDTVNYAEAVTMAVRTLGYANVAEKNGQWPTNYINKANELKLLEDVIGAKASDGAKRGEIAQILWNTLNTRMWEVESESEGNGLVSAKGKTMLETKFPDFTHKSGNDYVANFVDEENVTSVEIVDKDTIKVSFESVSGIYFDNVSPLEFVEGVKYDALYIEDEVEGVTGKQKVAKSLYKDVELIVAGKVSKATDTEVTIDGVNYKENKDTVITPALEGAVVVLELDVNGKVADKKILSTNNEILVKEVKTSADSETTKFVKYSAAANSDISVNFENKKDQMFVSYELDGTTKVLDIADVKAGMIIEEYTDESIVDLANSDVKLFLVSEKALNGKVDKVVVVDDDHAAVEMNGSKFALTTSDLVLFEGKKEPAKITMNQIKALIGQTITAKAATNGSIKYVEAEDKEVSNNYAILHSAWEAEDEGVLVEKVKIVTLTGEEKVITVKNGLNLVSGSAGAYVVTSIDNGSVIDYTLSDDEITVIAKKDFEAITKINKTAGIVTATSGDVAYDDSTKLIKYSKETVASKDVYKVTDFVMSSITAGAATNYVVIKDDTTNIAEYIIYNAQGAVSADKAYGIVVEQNNGKTAYIVREENNESIWAIDVKDVVTGDVTTYETNKGATSDVAALVKGDVVQVSQKANDFYKVEAFANAVGATGENARTLTANAAAVQYGANYKVTDGTDKLLFTSDAELIFVEDGVIVDKYGRDDIAATDVIYAYGDIDETIDELYTIVIIEK